MVLMVRRKRGFPTPEKHLGFPVGADRQLANWEQIVSYFHKLGELSDRILVEEIGKSTEGRPFLLVTVTASSNHANLDYYRQIQQKLADPRSLGEEEAEQLIAQGKTICLITCSIHATEVGAAQMSMELAYDLATREDAETKEILSNVIFLLVPSLNPDGLDLVVDWYTRSLGTRYEGMLLPELYQKYTGHDNNRDWFMATQVETQLAISRIHNVWHPHIVHDQHQQGSDGPRFVLPPFIDPYDENVDPILRGMVNWLGMSIASEMTGAGLAGVATNLTYDAFSPSRAYQHYHGGVRILSEAASVRVATPVKIDPRQMREVRGFDPRAAVWNHPLPWAGGDWRLRDIVDYDKTCAWACLRHAARYRDSWVNNFYRIHKKAIEYNQAPYAYIIPLDQPDPVVAAEMLWVLMFGGVEVKRAKAQFRADGVEYPAGTLIIPLNQPYGRYAKTLLEAQPYPDLRLYPGGPPKRPYDITAHSLPLQMGVKVIATQQPVQVAWDEVTDCPAAIAGPERFEPSGGQDTLLIGAHSNKACELVYKLQKAGCEAGRITIGTDGFAAGSFLVRGSHDSIKLAATECARYAVQHAAGDSRLPTKPMKRLPRVGLYKSFVPNADEGWTRFIFDQAGIDFVSVTNSDLWQGKVLDNIDCLILPSASSRVIAEGFPQNPFPPEYSGGIGAGGAEAILSFVKAGGTLVALDGACEWAIKQLWLPVTNVVTGLPQDKFYVPGSFLRVLLVPEHPVTYGLPRETTIVFVHSPAFELGRGAYSLADYPLGNPLVAGWMLGHEHLAGKSAMAEVPVGDGRVLLMGFRPQFRAQARGTYRILYNAIYYSVLGN